MSPLVPLVMFGWIPAVLLVFAVLPPRRAVVAAFIGAWLFLPAARYEFSGLPEYTKMSATCVGIFLGAALFDPQRLFAFRPHRLDLPMALWCAAPFLSSVVNGLGAYDGLSAMLNQITTWGLPYMVGRVYLASPEAFRTLAKAMFVGGLVYAPLCLLEIRISPQLHRMLYGFYAHPDFAQTIRLGGYRPMVFMEHGLMVGMWMASASLCGVWLWASGQVERIAGAPMRLLVPALLVVTVLVKSSGALLLLALGLGALFLSRRSAKRTLIAVLFLAAPLYMGFRTAGIWNGENLVDAIAVLSEDRADSLRFRMVNEDMLMNRALEQPGFGWGGWGRARVYDPVTGEDLSTTDGLWIITLGNTGLFGLASMTTALLLPAALFFARRRDLSWARPPEAAAAALAVLLALYGVDNVLNAMVNPVFILAAGGLTALATQAHRMSAPLLLEEDGDAVPGPALRGTRFI